jgi:hypothetical protein
MERTKSARLRIALSERLSFLIKSGIFFHLWGNFVYRLGVELSGGS